jgi:threonine aldolase
MIDYRSDNTGRAAPQILEALVRANHDTALGYGADEWTTNLQRRFSDLFETSVRVFPVATGTAANALALAALSPSWGIVYCSEVAHINTSEANAAGFFGGGVKLIAIGGQHGKIDRGLLAETLAGNSPAQLHRGQPSAVSLTQATDLGAVYTLDEIRAVAEVAKRRGLRLHMDGARFANAVARLGCSAANATWRSGIDIMSFGATKNGGALCDAIVVFSPDLADGLAVQLRRAGQVWSKMRFASAQLIAYVENGLWLDHGARVEQECFARRRRAARHPGRPAPGPDRGERNLPRTAGRDNGRAGTRRLPVLSPQPHPRPFRVPFRHGRGRGRCARRGAAPTPRRSSLRPRGPIAPASQGYPQRCAM